MNVDPYSLLRWTAGALARGYLGSNYRVRGTELVPRTGPLIVCPNHFGTLEPALVPAALPRNDSWSMAKAEWFGRGWATRWLFSGYHAFPVIRHSPDRGALRRAFAILAGGGCLVMFPEGTRIDRGGLGTPEPGAGYIAQRSGAAVLPVAVTGTREVLPRGRRLPTRRPLAITFGPPLRVRRTLADGALVSPRDAAAVIMLAVAEMLPPDLRGAFSDVEGLRDRLGGAYEPA